MDQGLAPELRELARLNWQNGQGVVCSDCGQEAFRARGGLCLPCWEVAHELELRLPEGFDASALETFKEIAKGPRS